MKAKNRGARRRIRLAGRSQLARMAHFRVSAGAMGGNRRQQARRRRQRDRMDEQEAAKQENRDLASGGPLEH